MAKYDKIDTLNANAKEIITLRLNMIKIVTLNANTREIVTLI